MFDDSVRSRHEPDDEAVIRKIIDIENGRLSQSDLTSYVRERDQRLCLDVDSSQLNFFLLDHLLEAFPDAVFILTIRDCYSWLNSFINDSLRRSTSKAWVTFREYRFRPDLFSHPPEEEALKRRGLYTLDGYLSYWARHNSRVLATVPKNRLLIVRTSEITKRAHDIAAFAGIPKESVRVQESHSFRNPENFNVLREVDESHLEGKVRAYCFPLMEQFFTDIRSMSDAGV